MNSRISPTIFIFYSLFLIFPLLPTPAGAQTYTLQQLKDSARQNNAAIRNARLGVEAARQQRKEAFTNYFPNVSGTGLWFNADKGMAKMTVNPADMLPAELGAALSQALPAEALAALGSPVGISMMKNGTLAGVTAMQPVFAGGQIVNGNRLAKVGQDVSQLQLQLSENEVEKTVERYYWQLVSLQEKQKTVDAVDTLLADIHKDVSVAVRAGVALRNDLLQVELRQNDVQSQRLKLQNGIAILRLVLAQYCGLDNSEELMVKKEESAAAMPSLESTGAAPANSSLVSLPEYQLLQKQVEAADLQRKMEVGKNLPTVAVGAGYNYHTLLDSDRSFTMLYATVTVPISDWWGGSHAVKRKQIAYRQAQQQLEDNAQLLAIRQQRAWADVVEAWQQLQLARRGIEQAQENLRLQRDYYRAGTCTMTDLLQAQLLYQQSCDKQTDAVADYHNKLLEYKFCS